MGSSNGAKRDLSVGIVGAGFGGVGIAIKLREAGFDRVRDLRARRQRRRRLAGEHLPGRRLRRPLAPLLVLVRPRASLVAPLRAPGGDPRLPRGGLRASYGIDPHLRFGTEITEAEFDAGDRALDAAHRRRRRARSSTSSSPPAASSPAPRSPRSRGSRSFDGPVLPLGRVGPRRRSRRPQRRGDRDGRERDPVRPRGRRRSPSGRRSTSARRPGSCRRTDRGYPGLGAPPVRALPAARGRRPGRPTSPSSSCSRTGSRVTGAC